MIIIHELGHYWAAVLCDVRVESFSVGFGPRLFGFKIGETDFRFSAILFGGYVKMLGQDDLKVDVGSNPDPRSFLNKPRYQRLFIAFAGPAMNILLSVALLTGLFMYQFPKLLNADGPSVVGFVVKDSPAATAGVQAGDRITSFDGISNPKWDDILVKELTGSGRNIPVSLDRAGQTVNLTVTPKTDERTQAGFVGWRADGEVQVDSLIKGYDAERAGLKPGDVVVSINQQLVRSTERLRELVNESNGQPIEVIYRRDNQMTKITVSPKRNDEEKRWMIGIGLRQPFKVVQLPFGEAFTESLRANMRNATMILDYLKGVVERRLSPKQFEGPVGIARMAAAAAKEGPADFLGLMAMVSLNLAIFNLLPIPVLDGGMILVLLIEMVRRRDLSLQLKERVLQAGLAFLLVLVVFTLYNDISKAIFRG
jgi:regulator of sigma E protease